MGKVIKILLSCLSALLLVLIIVPIFVTLLLNFDPVQQFVAGRLTGWLSDKLQTEVKVEALHLRLFNRVAMEGLYIEDYHRDTLFYARQIVVPLRSLNPFTGQVALGRVVLDHPKFYLMQDSTGRTNLKQILLRLKRDRPKKEKSPFRLTAGGVLIREMAFKHLKKERREREYGVNFTDLDVRNFNLKVREVSVVNDSITLQIDTLRLRERSGLVIRNLSTRHFIISGSTMRFERFALDTPDSQVKMNHLYFDYGTWQGYKDFIERVNLSADIVDSHVSFRTIAFFAPTLRSWQTVFEHVSGRMTGPVAAMKGELEHVECRDTRVSLRFGIFGIPKMETTRFHLDVKELQTNEQDASFLLADMAKGRKLQPAQQQLLRRLGNFTVNGKFDGVFSNFTASGLLSCLNGELGADLTFKSQRAATGGFVANVHTTNLDVGTLLERDKLGKLSLQASLSGTYAAASMKLQTEAKVSRLGFNGYDYQKISLNGEIDNRSFLGAIRSQDPNLAFDFDGQLAFNDTLPAYNFALQLYRADLNRLGFNPRDSISILRGNLVALGSGNSLDNINGEATVSHMVYVNHLDTVRTGNIRLVAQNSSDRKQLGMYSSFADVEFRGRDSYKKMFTYFTHTLVGYLPSIERRPETLAQETESEVAAQRARPAAAVDDYYLLKVNVKEANRVAGIFVPGLMLAEGTQLSFLFNPRSDMFTLSCTSDYIERGNFFVSNLNLNSRNQSDSISLFVRSDDIFVGGVYMPNFSVLGGVKNNRINLATRFHNKENGAYAMLSTVSTLQRDSLSGIPQLLVRFNPSTFTTGEQTWGVGAREIVWDSTRLVVDRFRMVSGDQQLLIDGVASRALSDTLHLRMNHFDLTPLSQITDRQGYRISGYTNGSADMAAVMGRGVLYANVHLDSIRVNDIPLRNTIFNSKWDFTTQRALFELTDKERQIPVIRGYYQPESGYYRADLQMDSINLSLIDPVLQGVIQESQGLAKASLRLSNPDQKMRLDGQITIPSFRTQVAYTAVPYTMDSALIDVRGSVMSLRPALLHDAQGHTAGLEMRFDFSNLRNLSYNVRVRPNGLQVLNTTIAQNDLFYGKVYASGAAEIKGDRNGVNMNITAQTDGPSQFFLPLSGNSSISAADFIVFEDPASAKSQDSVARMSRRKQILLNRKSRLKSKAPSRMNINMQLALRPDLEMQLVVDPTTGDVLKGRGNGSLNLTINPSNELFTIYGDYDITEGSYKFTLKNIVSRTFTLEPGSNIRWAGDPLDATLDITAVYKLKASLGALATSFGSTRNTTTAVDCYIKLADKLTDPAISFDIQVPNASPEIQTLVSQAINSQEAMATQFLCLIATKSFYGESQSFGSSMAASTGVDFLSNQLSSLLSSDRFSFVPKYTPRGEYTSDEVGGSIYGELIKNRLILEADVNYDTQNNKASLRQNNMSGDATLSLLLGKSGNFRLQAFTRTIEDFDPNQGTQESGIGIFYRESFNSFKDLRQIFRDRFARIGRRREAKKAAKTAEQTEQQKEQAPRGPIREVLPAAEAGKKTLPTGGVER